MIEKEIEKIQPQLEKAIEAYQSDLKNIRTNRATPALVEDVKVDYFGAKTPLMQIASISSLDARTLEISPWNKDTLIDIEKAINESDLGVTPNNDGNVIRIALPQLTEERRQELVKVLRKKTEEARIRIRREREEIWRDIQDKEKRGEISEDDKFRAKDKLQKLVDEYNQKIEELVKRKKEIVEI